MLSRERERERERERVDLALAEIDFLQLKHCMSVFLLGI